jgi:hypothetical protein
MQRSTLNTQRSTLKLRNCWRNRHSARHCPNYLEVEC